MKRLIKLITGLLFGLMFYGNAIGGVLIVRLLENATVVGPRVSLGDVADLIGQNNGNLERVRRTAIGKAAPAGDSIKVTLDYIKVTLRREGYSLNDFSFEGSGASKVLTKSQKFSPSDLLSEVKAFVLRQLKESPENVVVKMTGPNKKILLPAGDIKTTLRPTFSGKYEGTVLLTAELEINGHLGKVLPLRVNIEIYHPVVATTKRIEKGEKFTDDNTALVRTSASKITSGSFHQLNYVLGRTASMPLIPGTIVRVDAIYDPPVISHGQIVHAIVRKGNIELTVDTRAIEDGKAGEVIRVENTASHKVLRGRILDERTVLVDQEKP